MKTTGLRILFLWMMTLSLGVIAGCGAGGGGGGASSLAITISSLSASTMDPGTSISGSIAITANAAALNGVTVSVVTDAPEISASVKSTDASGKATFTLSAASTVQAKKNVQVWAVYDGVKSNVMTLTLNSMAESSTFNVTIGTAEEFAQTIPIGSAASLGNIVVAGNKVEFKGPNGVITSVPVKLEIYRIDNWALGDNVKVNGVDFADTLPTLSTTVTTSNLDGTALIPTIITVILPPAPATAGQNLQHVYAIYWRATVTYNGVDYSKTAVTTVTGKTTAQ